jgi:hypothetical protein
MDAPAVPLSPRRGATDAFTHDQLSSLWYVPLAAAVNEQAFEKHLP